MHLPLFTSFSVDSYDDDDADAPRCVLGLCLPLADPGTRIFDYAPNQRSARQGLGCIRNRRPGNDGQAIAIRYRTLTPPANAETQTPSPSPSEESQLLFGSCCWFWWIMHSELLSWLLGGWDVGRSAGWMLLPAGWQQSLQQMAGLPLMTCPYSKCFQRSSLIRQDSKP